MLTMSKIDAICLPVLLTKPQGDALTFDNDSASQTMWISRLGYQFS